MPKHRDGGKMRGTHTTLTDLGAEVVDLIQKLGVVRGVSTGLCQAGKGVAGGCRKVKIVEGRGHVILTVRQSHSVNEIRVFSGNLREAMFRIACTLRDNDIPISF